MFTCHVDLLGVGGAGRGRAGAVGEVAPRAVVDVFHLGLQLAQPQHDVVQQHGQGLLQVCEERVRSMFYVHQNRRNITTDVEPLARFFLSR